MEMLKENPHHDETSFSKCLVLIEMNDSRVECCAVSTHKYQELHSF